MQAIGTNLRRLRVRAGLTQDALAGMLHVTRQTVSSWEIGRTEPDLDTLLALAEALHCDATELISRIYGDRCSCVSRISPVMTSSSAIRRILLRLRFLRLISIHPQHRLCRSAGDITAFSCAAPPCWP